MGQYSNRATIHVDGEIDLVVNEHYNTVESIMVRNILTNIGVEAGTYEQIDGGIGGTNQWVVIETDNPDNLLLIKLAFEKYSWETWETW